MLGALSALAVVAPAASAATSLYPDIRTFAPGDLRLERTDVSADRSGQMRNTLRFSNTTWNAGEGPLILRSDALDASRSGAAIQRVMDDAGGFTERPVGAFSYHVEHQHMHFTDWGRYELWTKADFDTWLANGRSGPTAERIGTKTSSCLLDDELFEDRAGTPSAVVYSMRGCFADPGGKLDQGLSVGWADTYTSNMFEQWIDFGQETLADGDYVLRAVADPENRILESAGGLDTARETAAANEGVTPLRIAGGKLVDLAIPSGTVTINGIAKETASPRVTVKTVGRDDVAGVDKIRVSNDGVAWAEYPYTATGTEPQIVDWDLTDSRYGGTAGTGARAVYVQVHDRSGKWSPSISDTIRFTGSGPGTPPTSDDRYRQRVLESAPVSYWRLGEASGAAATDQLGANNGAYMGGPTLGAAGLLLSDRQDKAASLDGVNDYMRVPDSASLDLTDKITVEAWVKPRALPAEGTYANIVSKAEAYSLEFNGPRLSFLITQAGYRTVEAPLGAVPVGQVSHVVGTYDGGEMRLYVNGQMVATRAQTGPAKVGTYPLNIGTWAGNGDWLNGTVDEAAVYGHVLTALEVKNHHDIGISSSVGVARPTGLAATAVSPSRIDLAWTDNALNEDRYVVERDTSATFSTPTAVELGPNATSYAATGLSPETTYYFRVRAVAASDASDWSAAASAATQPAPPPAVPTGLTATAASPTEIALSWTDAASDETSYVVQRDTSTSFSSPVSTRLAAGTTTYRETGLTPSTGYVYRVRAERGTSVSPWSATATATTQDAPPPPPPPPATPIALTATALSTSEISFTWSDVATDETAYVVQRDSTSGFTSPVTTRLAAGTAAHRDTGLAASTTYFYRVRAERDATASAWSATRSATTQAPPPPPPPPPPAVPTNVTASALSASEITVGWTDAATDETSYVVQRDSASGFTSPVTTRLAAGATSLRDSGLAAATTFFYRVRAERGTSVSAWSDTRSATTQAAPPPPPPPPPPAGYRDVLLSDGPIAYWRLGETSGTTMTDQKGTSNGVYAGSPALGAASLLGSDTTNKAIRFDGINDFGRVKSSALLNPSGAVTLEAWVNPRAFPPAGDYASIISKPESYSLELAGSQLSFLVIQNYVYRTLKAPVGALPTGRASHVAATYDGVTQRLYVNGTQVASRAQTGPISATTYDVFVGTWGGVDDVFDGIIDEPAIYAKALTAARIGAHRDAGGTTAAAATTGGTSVARAASTRRAKQTFAARCADARRLGTPRSARTAKRCARTLSALARRGLVVRRAQRKARAPRR